MITCYSQPQICSIRFHYYLLQFRSHVLDTLLDTLPHCLVSARGDLRLNMPEDSLKALSNHGSEAWAWNRWKPQAMASAVWKSSESIPCTELAVAQLCRFTNYKNIQEYSRFLQILTHFMIAFLKDDMMLTLPPGFPTLWGCEETDVLLPAAGKRCREW